QSFPEQVRPKFSHAQSKERENFARTVLEFAKKNTKIITIFLIIIGFIWLVWWGVLAFKSLRKTSLKAAKQKTSEVRTKIKDKAAEALSISDSLRLSVKAKSDCWLRVRVDDKLIFQGILKKGEVEGWQAEDKIEMKIGNPAAVDLELNGRVLEQFGRRGSKNDFVTITREGLKIGK
ncbi:MAG: DUF4115 domain-containing protein, partial [Candidatus Omnitrophota bacterium]